MYSPAPSASALEKTVVIAAIKNRVFLNREAVRKLNIKLLGVAIPGK
jgi:hypothetical protein